MLLTAAILIYMAGFGQDKTKKLIITPLEKDFYIYTTFNDPGNGESYPSNGMYFLTDEGAVMIDTPWDTTQFQPLLDSIKIRHNQMVVMCISTHFHDDRTAGLNYYKQLGIKTYTTRLTDLYSKKMKKPRAKFLIDHDTTFLIGQHSFKTFYPGKGHSSDNIVLWFDKEKILYGGCFVKSTETDSPGNLSDANIDEWMRSIKKVRQRFKNPQYIITGHLEWKSKNSLDHTVEILKKYKREQHALNK